MSIHDILNPQEFAMQQQQQQQFIGIPMYREMVLPKIITNTTLITLN